MLVDDYTSILPAVLREHNTEDRVIYLTAIMKGKTNVIIEAPALSLQHSHVSWPVKNHAQVRDMV